MRDLEIRQASHRFEGHAAWAKFLEVRSAARAERTSPDTGVEIRTEQMKWLSELAYRTSEHLGAEEFSIRTGRTLEEAEELLHRLTART